MAQVILGHSDLQTTSATPRCFPDGKGSHEKPQDAVLLPNVPKLKGIRKAGFVIDWGASYLSGAPVKILFPGLLFVASPEGWDRLEEVCNTR